MADPVLWAKAFVVSNDATAKKVGPWKARDYQEEMLRDKSLYKVYRCGRRCLTGDTLIMDPTDGKYYTVLDLYEKGSANVVAMDSDYTLKTQTSCPVMYNGEKEVFELTTQKGRSIKATSNHPFFTSSGWKELGDLKVGDYIAVPSELPFFGDNVIDDDTIIELASAINNCGVRFILDTIFTLKRRQITLFLSSLLLQGESKPQIEYSSDCETLIRQIAHLLLRLGTDYDIRKEQNRWTLIISDTSLLKNYSEEDIAEASPCSIVWRKITSIESKGIQDTYDLHVPGYNNFVANDIITHNTGKSETMIIEGLHKAYTHEGFRILYVTPYETQVNLIFMRMRELIQSSPLLKIEVVKMKNSPYTIEFKNGSVIMGFTTGASSGSGAASVRGQRADWLFLDEIDYMGTDDYSTVAMIAGERSDIGMTCSSTPTGARREFYKMCTDPAWGYSQHFHPSMHNPGWCQEMEDKFRASLTPSQYEHEILAEFGTEESGVFPKDKLDAALKFDYYAYSPLTSIQLRNLMGGPMPCMLDYDDNHIAPPNPYGFRCVGVDFDQFQAGSSIIVLDYDVNLKKFKVIKRVEVPRAEYSLDNAVNWIIKINNIYNPSWIFCDRGYGEQF